MSSTIPGQADKLPANTYIVVLSDGTRITLPVPKVKPKYEEEDLQLEAWRDEAGYLHKVEARRSLRRLDLEWSYLNDDQMYLIKHALKSQEYFQFIFYDYQSGLNGTLNEAYSGNITYELYSLRHGEGEWVNVKVAIIER